MSLGDSEKQSGTEKAVARGAHPRLWGGKGEVYTCACVYMHVCLGSQGPLLSPGAAPLGGWEPQADIPMSPFHFFS